jgi:hypothetical protein
MRGADLREVDLSGAHLFSTNLTADLSSSTNLTGAIFSDTVFADIDLTSVTGLEECEHTGPSVIDHRTLQKSGSLPIKFLRGIGLPDNLIEYVPSLKATQYYSSVSDRRGWAGNQARVGIDAGHPPLPGFLGFRGFE